MEDQVYAKVAAYMGAALVMGIGSIGPALGQGLIGMKACENIGKYPESSGKISQTMMIAMGLVETSAIYALLIALLLIFKF
ncbi:MAG: ATP synthase F0 subunit C [Candidatus Dependentiae bacterium]|nr:ATP synthase F0 subunit C [Candidatus Dependentiae bacterium]